MTKTYVSLPLLLAVSVLPDIDLLLRGLLHHRGPTHSIVTFTVIMIPFLIVYRKKVLPYFAAVLTHSLIGDYFTGGLQLLWPLWNGWFGVNIDVRSLAPLSAEIILFIAAVFVMWRSRDLRALLKPNKANYALVITFAAVLGPLFLRGRSGEEALPELLWLPSLLSLAMFGYSLFVTIKGKPEVSAGKKKG